MASSQPPPRTRSRHPLMPVLEDEHAPNLEWARSAAEHSHGALHNICVEIKMRFVGAVRCDAKWLLREETELALTHADAARGEVRHHDTRHPRCFAMTAVYGDASQPVAADALQVVSGRSMQSTLTVSVGTSGTGTAMRRSQASYG